LLSWVSAGSVTISEFTYGIKTYNLIRYNLERVTRWNTEIQMNWLESCRFWVRQRPQKKLTEFYAKARFKINSEDFNRQYTDGADDGGIDFYYNEDNTFFIFQTKFSENPKKVSTSEILDEIRKIENTLITNNPNKRAEDFVNLLKREAGNKDTILEVLWLTTNIVEQSVRDEVQKHLESWRKENGWALGVDFVAIDKYTLESVIYDIKHGYIPYTGKKILKLEQGQWIETTWEETGVHSVVCTVNVNDILKWFHDSDEINRFLQKMLENFSVKPAK